jgi:Haem-binding domain
MLSASLVSRWRAPRVKGLRAALVLAKAARFAVPGSWLVEHDVHEGRNHLNMSQWQRYNLETQVDLLTEIASEARTGRMPVKQYLILHPKARLSSEEQQLIYDWAKAERKHIKQQIESLQDKPAAN